MKAPKGRGPFHVRRAVPGDEAIVRSLRLQALSDSPDDFDSTLKRESAWMTSNWRELLSHGATFILAQSDGPKGIAAGIPNRDDRASIFLVLMWLHPGLRGSGAADALVASVIVWAEEQGTAEVWLHVVKRNGRARRFYERNGFRRTGQEVIRERDGVVELEMRRSVGGRARRWSVNVSPLPEKR